MKLHKEGIATVLIALLVFCLINGLMYWQFGESRAFYICLIITLIPTVLVVSFFRTPRRHAVKHEDAIIAPADGKIVAIEEVYEPEVLKCQCLQVSVFMSVFNVHINWFPVNGVVKYSKHHNGNFMAAWLPKSSTQNERTSVAVERANGETVLIRQVAGALARRIVCYAKENSTAKQGEQMGFIKFGSRVDLYLPIGTQIDVNLGDKVTGSQTILGWFKK